MDIERQVVSGILYKIEGVFKNAEGEFMNCKIEMWERAWEKEEDKLKLEVKSSGKIEGDSLQNILNDEEPSKETKGGANVLSYVSRNLFLFLLLSLLLFIN